MPFSSPKILGSATLQKNKKTVRVKALHKTLQRIMAYLSVTVLLIAVLGTATSSPRYDLILSELPRLFTALWNTLIISLISLLFSLLGGFFFYLGVKSTQTFVHAFFIALREVLIGTPLLVMIFLVVYVFGVKLGIHNKLALGIFALTVHMIPYLSHSYQAASEVIDKNQYIVMDLYHFTLYQRYRYIILPQMIKPLIPAILNNLSSIIKSSSLLKIISVSEISYVLTVISNKNYASVEGYMIMWMMYLLVTIPLSILTSKLGARYSRGN